MASNYDDELNEFLRVLRENAEQMDSLGEMIKPYLEKLERASSDPEELLDDLELKTERVSGQLLEALDQPDEDRFVDLASSMAEWSVPAVALGFCMSNGMFGDPDLYDAPMQELADGMAKIQLGILHCLHNSDYSYDALMRLAPMWMQTRANCMEVIHLIG